jgi:hypothetical protein
VHRTDTDFKQDVGSMHFQIYRIVLKNLSTVNDFFKSGLSQMFQVKCRGCIIGT